MQVKNSYILLIISVLCSCVTSRKVNLLQPIAMGSASSTQFEEYKIEKNDRLDIYVYSLDSKLSSVFNPDYSSREELNVDANVSDLATYLVDDSGEITFPLVGKVEMAGLQTREAKHRLEKKISEKFFDDTTKQSISVDIRVIRRYFNVVGPMGSGRYKMTKEKMTIYEAIALFGNIDDFSDRSKMKLVRTHSDGHTTVTEFDMRSVDIINSEAYYIEPNDVLYIPKMKGYSFGFQSITNTVAIVAATLSFGVLIYGVVDRIVK